MRFSTSFVLFMMGLSLGAWIVHLAGGEPIPENVAAKLQYYEDHRDTIDTVHIGTSRIWRHLSPAVFDSQMAARGRQTSSFNMGLMGLRPGEVRRIVREIYSREPFPKLLVVESLQPGTMSSAERADPNADVLTNRSVWWRTFSDIPTVVLNTFNSGESLTSRWKLVTLNLRRTVIRKLRIGSGVQIVLGLFAPKKTMDYSTIEKGRGFDALSEESLGQKEFARRHAQLGLFGSYAEALQECSPASWPKARARHERFQRQIRERVSGKAEHLVFVVPPGSKEYCPRSEPAAGDVIFMNDPLRFASLYRIEKWIDLSHLNEQGALEFSELFADELVKRID